MRPAEARAASHGRAHRARWAAVLVACAGALWVRDTGAQVAGRGPQPSASAPARPAPDPSVDEEEDDEMPPGHPPVDTGNPHAHPAAGQGMPGVFQPPEDTEQPDPTLPPGSIEVDLRDADDHPVAHETVTLGILVNSVAKGDSRRHVQGTTGDDGRTVFGGLDTSSSNTAYRVSAGYEGGLFAASPFQLQQVRAMRVVLHVYHVVRDLRQALIVCEATVAADLKDDRMQIEEALNVYNLGRTAWQPDDVRIALPDGFTAFNAQTSMTDQGVDQSGKDGKLRGTFSPGRHAVEFRYQLPWHDDPDLSFTAGVPPHVAIARAMMPASAKIKLDVDGFPPAEIRRDAQGQSFLVTERHLRPEDKPLSSLVVNLHDLPTVGPGKYIATVVAGFAVLIGLGITAAGRKDSRPADPKDAKAQRARLLEDLADLERAHAGGDVGPKTYERLRRELLDAIARTLLKV